MLAYTPLDEKSLALLLNYLHDFLKYLAKNSATLFSASDYEVAPPEDHRRPCEALPPWGSAALPVLSPPVQMLTLNMFVYN
ncbi:Mortality factor 4-like protein 1 [Myotis brandtii]|uniref:Mortality factor 4-like protein 1 n=1 Tax=Myotis brandtii TaxID=109478 RepID=S7NA70_MYOBR|nr:Mortality factor 4-like protein 1 [Myotis brandtii]